MLTKNSSGRRRGERERSRVATEGEREAAVGGLGNGEEREISRGWLGRRRGEREWLGRRRGERERSRGWLR